MMKLICFQTLPSTTNQQLGVVIIVVVDSTESGLFSSLAFCEWDEINVIGHLQITFKSLSCGVSIVGAMLIVS